MWRSSLHLYGVGSPMDNGPDDNLALKYGYKAIADGVRVVNMSFGFSCSNGGCDLQDTRALIELSNKFKTLFNKGANVLWVCAAGNDHQDQTFQVPARLSATLPNVVSVSAINQQRALTAVSNYGQVTVSAPGVNVPALTPNDGYTNQFGGTSASAPYVTGVAGLMLSVDSNLSAFELKTTVHYSAASTGNFDPEGKEVFLLDAAHAVEVAKSAFYLPDGSNFVTINIPFARRPDRFPVDLPLEDPGQAVTQNYVAASSDGKFQQTRVFNTTRDLNGAIESYKTYFISHGWSLLADVSISNFRVVAFQKGDQIMDVQMNLLPFKSIAIDLSVVPQV
jgi:subtilisin family serine protease